MLSSVDPRCVPGGLEGQLSEVPLGARALRGRQLSFLFLSVPVSLPPSVFLP